MRNGRVTVEIAAMGIAIIMYRENTYRYHAPIEAKIIIELITY